MDESVLDEIFGKHYKLETLNNDVVRVESAGNNIRVGIKDARGGPNSWWELTYPFAPPPAGVSWPKQNGWTFTVEAPSPEVAIGIFEREGERHVLTICVTDPYATPKPVELTWE